MMTHTLKDRLLLPESKLEYRAWSPFPDEEELDEEEITIDNNQVVW